MSETQTKLLSATPATTTIDNGEYLAKVDANGQVSRISMDNFPVSAVKSNYAGATIAGYCNLLVIAYSKSDPNKYLVYVAISQNLANVVAAKTIVLAKNGLVIEATNQVGTICLGGAEDIEQYVLRLNPK